MLAQLWRKIFAKKKPLAINEDDRFLYFLNAALTTDDLKDYSGFWTTERLHRGLLKIPVTKSSVVVSAFKAEFVICANPSTSVLKEANHLIKDGLNNFIMDVLNGTPSERMPIKEPADYDKILDSILLVCPDTNRVLPMRSVRELLAKEHYASFAISKDKFYVTAKKTTKR